MRTFTVLNGIAAPLMRANIDTDAIIPGDQLLRVADTGFGDGLFSNWRYNNIGTPEQAEKPDFILNRVPYREATILLSGINFACGSSREVAVWALRDWGIRCVIAPSFGQIFFSNCFNNGMLPVVLPIEAVETIARQVEASDGHEHVTIDLKDSVVVAPDGQLYPFTIAQIYRHMLLEGLAQIEASLRFAADLEAYEKSDRFERPWIYEPGC